jgi:pyrroloquinoline quinone biosynthesis protein B
VSADGQAWFLLNASPEIRTHVESFAGLHPRAPRHTPIAGVFVTNGDLDHCLGLLCLRESQPLAIYATERVHRGFVDGNVLNATLERFAGQTTWHALQPGRPIEPAGTDGRPSGLEFEPVAAPGQPPLHLRSVLPPSPEDNVGFRIRDRRTGGVLAYFSGVAGPTVELREALEGADCTFFDGTFWSSEELIRLGLGERRAEDMAHWPVGGPSGSLATLGHIGRGRRIYIHLNNTNPILIEDSRERAAVTAGGWEVAHDGLEVQI